MHFLGRKYALRLIRLVIYEGRVCFRFLYDFIASCSYSWPARMVAWHALRLCVVMFTLNNWELITSHADLMTLINSLFVEQLLDQYTVP